MSDPICPTCTKPITDEDAVMHHNCLEPIEIELWQAKGELGYAVPGHIPQSKTLKCGLCEAKAKQLLAREEKLAVAVEKIEKMKRIIDETNPTCGECVEAIADGFTICGDCSCE